MPKCKPNGYFCFMQEWKKREEKKGRRFPNGMRDVQSDSACSDEWKNMPDDKKNYYKNMAKKDTSYLNKEKRTGQGYLLSDLEKQKLKEEAFMDNMNEYISTLINTAKMNQNIPQLKFYVIHMNHFYSRPLNDNEIEYYPAEISIVEFSLEKGILRKYHQIVNEKIQLGYSCAAKSHSSGTHQIPINPGFGKSDYREIFGDICKFLEPGKVGRKYPVLYTFFLKENIYLPIKLMLNNLYLADDKPDDYLLLYSLEKLFTNIYNAAIEGNEVTAIVDTYAKMQLEKDIFAYNLGLECDYHDRLKAGSLHCSQSIVTRWIFILYKFCCPLLKISIVPGVHCPMENSEDNPEIEVIESTFSSLQLNSSRFSSNQSSVMSEEVTERPLRVPRNINSLKSKTPYPSIGRGRMN